ncbi:hypothetical protein DCAR_0729540 [Daucus carota subsp. sativus]|uniref:Uncharacterized protein n=1 Tax=Daucus carota subsp. sativus TaxID=79200 RepID=A0A161ZMN9_DAUCS|nr:hypothetical protein DCAR_0729540 [Daucus carota subsp. sativus]
MIAYAQMSHMLKLENGSNYGDGLLDARLLLLRNFAEAEEMLCVGPSRTEESFGNAKNPSLKLAIWEGAQKGHSCPCKK